MVELKHSFSEAVKRRLLAATAAPLQNQAMLDYSALAVAARLREAMDAEQITNTELANACDVTVQAVGNWRRTGKISREKIALVARTIRRTTDWLLTGEESPTWAVRDRPDAGSAQEETEEGDPRKRAMLELWEKLTPEQRDALFRLLGVQTDQQAK